MKKLYSLLVFTVLSFILTLPVNAATPDDFSQYPYVLSFQKGNSNKYFLNYCLNGDDDLEPFLFSTGTYFDYFGYYRKSTKSLSFDSSLPFQTKFFESDNGGNSYIYNGPSGSCAYFNSSGFTILHCDFPAFQSKASAENYYLRGIVDADAFIPEPPAPEFDSIAYDFTQDLYNPEYPLPELSDLSYDSFYIHNSNGYSFDLVVQTTFYGTKMEKYSEGGNHYITDKLRKFRQHEYNFTLADPLSISGLVSIKDIYSIDLLETFKSDWIDWSNLYPSLDTLPGYSWINSIGYTSRDYLNYRVYNEDLVSERGLLTSLDLTGCCETKFFVRYRDDAGYGQWMVYTVSGTDSDGVSAEVGEAGKPAYITTGAVTGSTASGVPIITDPVTQRYDPINQKYDVVLNDGSDINWNLSVENFESAFSFFGEMPNFVAVVFSCYPAWMVQIIGATITFLCALAIYHGIRG